MDLSQQFKNLLKDDKESERKNKKLLEASVNQVHLERNIRDAKSDLSRKLDELVNVRIESIVLGNEVLVLEKRMAIAKQNIKNMLKTVIVAENETKNLQVILNLTYYYCKSFFYKMCSLVYFISEWSINDFFCINLRVSFCHTN